MAKAIIDTSEEPKANKSVPIKQGTSVRVVEPDTIVPEDFIYNDFEEQEYVRLGIQSQMPDRLHNSQEKVFFSNVDTRQGAIEREVTKIVRIRAIDYNSPKKERKEFIMYYENWHGKDWQGNIIAPVTDHVEGWYQSLESVPVTDKGRIIDHTHRNGPIVYYIPFSKEKVDEIIKNSVGTDKETIKYVIKTDTLRSEIRDTADNYNVFVTYTFKDLKELQFPTRMPQRQ